ncbi:hypothetical protein DFJ73DRAFT_771110 [Zopfochytrium polystomum]|nr:hypothetical protein DFJ73DRAFT_771110 [Zopfochytrium polystomum]
MPSISRLHLLALPALIASLPAAAFVYQPNSVFYLADCATCGINSFCPTAPASYIMYVPDGSSNGVAADYSAVSLGSLTTWQSANHGSDFTNGGRLSWSIVADALSHPNGETVGDAFVHDQNGLVKGGLSCHKGDNHYLSSSPLGLFCNQVFYCH